MKPVALALFFGSVFSMSSPIQAKTESIVLGGGCFWCTQAAYDLLPGKGCFLKDGTTQFTKAVRQKLLVAEIDQAVVTAHHLQVGREAFLETVVERLDYFEQQIGLKAKES